MDHQEILSRVDHTILTPTAAWEQVKAVCDEGLAFSTASVCIPPPVCKAGRGTMWGNQLKICTVIGFPNGYSTPEVKVFETEDAVRNGADEIDMVHEPWGWPRPATGRVCWRRSRRSRPPARGRILKVIVEACLLTREEKVAVCRVVSMSGADFIKTSTGFSAGGATVEDVKLFKEHISPDLRIKAAGGIRTFEQAQAMLEAGADRIGASALVASGPPGAAELNQHRWMHKTAPPVHQTGGRGLFLLGIRPPAGSCRCR